jgi:hypothetical protein
MRHVVACAEASTSVPKAAARMSRVIARMVGVEWSRAVHATIKRLGLTKAELPPAITSRRILRLHTRCTIDSSGMSMRKLESVAKTLVVTMMTSARTAGALDVVDAMAMVERVDAARIKRKKKKKRLTKQWVSLGDGKTCEECDELDGDTVNAYSMFKLSEDRTPKGYDYHGDEIEGPELHPNCRCDLLIDRA